MMDHHKDIGFVLSVLDEKLPTFLFGHSMGSLNTTSFLLNNPKLNIMGLFAHAPFYNFADGLVPTYKRYIMPFLTDFFSDFVIVGKVNAQYVAENHTYCYKRFVANKKSVPLLNIGTIVSWIDIFEQLPVNAKNFNYPYCLLYGDRD